MTAAEKISWDPWAHLTEWYPDVRVIEAVLPERVLGCIDHGQRIIWLARDMTDAQRRSTLAYEVGCLELGPFDRDHGDGGMVADWASRLLISFEVLHRCSQRHSELADVAEELCVDLEMLRARLRGLTEEEATLIDVARWRQSS